MSFLEGVLNKHTVTAQSIFFNVKFIIFSFGLISAFGFLMVYCFLYGYYFSGNKVMSISNFNIISNLVPFSLQMISMTIIFFTCIYYILSSLLSLSRKTKENKWWLYCLFLLTIILLNIFITLFFANELSFISFLSFLLVWVFIGLIVWSLYVLINFSNNFYIMLKSMFFVVFILLAILIISISFLKIESKIVDLIITLLIIPLFLLTITIFHKFYTHKLIAFLSYLSFFFFLFLVMGYFINTYIIRIPFKISFILMLSLIFSLIFLNFFFKKEIDFIHPKFKSQNKEADIKSKEEINGIDTNENTNMLYQSIIIFYNSVTNKTDKRDKFILAFLLFLIFVSIPRLSLLCGQNIRNLNVSTENTLEICYIYQNGIEKGMLGKYIIENNSTLYISNNDWQLEIIKPINYHVKSINSKKEKDLECLCEN
ncbi:hypothetical protein [Rummeliibacillus sp. TYF-LIM-RU47]|uniref:hypothetical protein n=1 Tax=unclassified Rummeliibacillus TaxID=2622809 RepID=UPI00123A35CA|nr:hypothetical protein [Rummeliibacillus sp. TYF-LIM-RU47]